MATTATRLGNRANALRRHYGADSPEYQTARREWATTSIEEHIERIVAAAPPLTQQQRDHLAGLLRPTVAAVVDLEQRTGALFVDDEEVER